MPVAMIPTPVIWSIRLVMLPAVRKFSSLKEKNSQMMIRPTITGREPSSPSFDPPGEARPEAGDALGVDLEAGIARGGGAHEAAPFPPLATAAAVGPLVMAPTTSSRVVSLTRKSPALRPR